MSDRENRYAEAIWPSENGKFRNPHLRELEDEQVHRVMAMADEERAADRAEIERLTASWFHERDCRADAEARLDALVADLRGLIAPGVMPDGEELPEWVHLDDLRAVLDKHAGELSAPERQERQS